MGCPPILFGADVQRPEAAMIILHKVSPGVSEAVLTRFLASAKRAAGVQGSVNVLITSSQELRLLNRRFRGKDKPTDVLSFPPEFVAHGFAGDVAISLEIARKNARSLRHDVADELKILMLHGVLHLAGYDHESDGGEMWRLEEKLRKKLRLPVALIERAAGPRAADRRPRQSCKRLAAAGGMRRVR
jgi:probable rRNA maturation factor